MVTFFAAVRLVSVQVVVVPEQSPPQTIVPPVVAVRVTSEAWS